jgi:pimeloyl-ACP methyl ester carboxylesterase
MPVPVTPRTDWLASRRAALRLLRAHTRPEGLGSRAVPLPRARRVGSFDVDVYEPVVLRRGVLVCAHGISPLAQRDPRWMRLLSSFAAAGYRVLSPRFESIASLRIHAGQPAELVDAVEALCAIPALVPSGRVGLLGVSLSGSFALVAAADPRIAHRVSAVASIGGYTDILRVIGWLLTTPDADPYGAWLVLANSLPLLGPEWESAASLVRDGARHLFYRSPWVWEERVAAALADGTLSASCADAVLPLVRHGTEREVLWQRLHAALQERFAPLDPASRLADFRAPIVLIHGASDRVIPAEESRQLAQQARTIGHAVHLCVTPLLSHGDAQGGLAWLGVPALGNAFATYLEHVSRDASRPRHAS